jgi:uncharacterized protein YrzB (UPF0473 family)
MDEDYGGSFITIEDDEGHEIEMEILDTLEHEGEEYVLFLPADMDEDDPDFGYVILQIVEVDGEEQFQDVEDQELLQTVYEKFMERIFGDEE